MWKGLTIAFILIIILAGAIFLIFKNGDDRNIEASITVSEALSVEDSANYKKAIGKRHFTFPEDYGAHPGYKTEWWYFTGNLENSAGRKFGYQFTIFRIALSPDIHERESNWATNHFHMAHFAISDIKNEKLHYFEDFCRADGRLAGVTINPIKIWIKDWQIRGIYDENPADPTFHITANAENISIDLKLENQKPVILQGEQGLSQKGPEKGNASYYYSFTNLKTTGKIKLKEDNFEVSGLSWMDREWSTSALGEDQEGWDWFSLHLSDGRELMYYQLRRTDGTPAKYSSGSLITADGEKIHLKNEDVTLKPLEYWESNAGARCPIKWRMEIPRRGLSLTIEACYPDQQLDVSVKYWEGAVKVTGKSGAKDISGKGYLEMTGYAGSSGNFIKK